MFYYNYDNTYIHLYVNEYIYKLNLDFFFKKIKKSKRKIHFKI